MCKHGNYNVVEVIQKGRRNQEVKVDACIANDVRALNEAGIVTIGSCCGHGFESNYPHVLIDEESVDKAKALGYNPVKYFHGPKDFRGAYEIKL